MSVKEEPLEIELWKGGMSVGIRKIYENLFKSYDDCDDEIVETRSKNIFDSDDDEDMTPRDMVHPEEYSDMNHYWDTNRYFDLNKYF